MAFRWDPREQFHLARYFIKWLVVVLPLGLAVGSACALFLWSLERVTNLRWDHPWLLFLLPVGGVAIALLYHVAGKRAEAGNNLIVDEIHQPGGGVPARMAPLVLVGTIVTHLLGGSAGREGTAVQMGGSIAATYARLLRRFTPDDTRTLLMAGVAAGFGGVFGTPLAGAVFALEVLAIGRMSYEAVLPCLLAAVFSEWACGVGIQHTDYHLAVSMAAGQVTHLDWLLAGKVTLAAVAFGLCSLVFAELTHSLQRIFKWAIPWPLARPFVGGLLVIGLVYALGTRDYLGLGVTSPEPHAVTILSAFHAGGSHPWSWWWKVLFTTVTLASGFKGGEVTPLFFIGATLGNTLAWVMGAPVELFAALGFVGVFAGATNTPLACTIMAIELFGPAHVVYFGLACFVAYLFSGHSGVYLSQRIGTPKPAGVAPPPDISLRTQRDRVPPLAILRAAVRRFNRP